MAKAKKAQALAFTLSNKAGQLSAVCGLIAEAGVNIAGIQVTDSGANADFHIVTAKNAKARKALAPLGVEIRDEDVLSVALADKAGRLLKVAKRLADAGINVLHAWATTSDGKKASLILRTSDDKKALALINKEEKK